MPSKRQRVSDIAKADEAVGKGMLSHLGTSSPRVHNGAAACAARRATSAASATHDARAIAYALCACVLRGALCVY